MGMEKQHIDQKTFIQLRDLIYDRCGIFFHEKKTYLLEDRLSRRMREQGFSSYEEYLYYLRYDPKKDVEMKEVVNIVTTNETFFFRDEAQLDAFSSGILPVIVDNNKNSMKLIKVWSAACSTGEEPYTLGMIMAENGLLSNGWRLNIVGSDINDKVIATARRGIYGDYAVRNIPSQYKKRYFDNGSDTYAITKKIKDMVRYENINLLDHSRMMTMTNVDVIFCRNVLIYFDDNAKKKVIGHFYDSLKKGGYLVTGFSETLYNISRAFRPVGINKCIVYQKV